jgi:mono/diheme cytochrome c family protein
LSQQVDLRDTGCEKYGLNTWQPACAGRRLLRTRVALSLALFSWMAYVCAAQQKPAKKPADQGPPSGAELYKRYCAVCHGNDGKGNGPPPPSSHFSKSPPDLTTLSQRHDGKFPDAYVADVLRSGVPLPDHGSSEMPIWGEAFRAAGGLDEDQLNLRIKNLTNYIRSRQVK